MFVAVSDGWLAKLGDRILRKLREKLRTVQLFNPHDKITSSFIKTYSTQPSPALPSNALHLDRLAARDFNTLSIHPFVFFRKE